MAVEIPNRGLQRLRIGRHKSAVQRVRSAGSHRLFRACNPSALPAAARQVVRARCVDAAAL